MNRLLQLQLHQLGPPIPPSEACNKLDMELGEEEEVEEKEEKEDSRDSSNKGRPEESGTMKNRIPMYM